MKFKILILVFFVSFNLTAQIANEKIEEEKIKKTISVLVEGWKQGSGKKFASAFTEEADFTVLFGMHIQSRKAIAEGHDFIFDRFYANTVWALRPVKINFLSADIALAHCSGAIHVVGETVASQPAAVPLLVLKKLEEGEWKITALQNTPYLVDELSMDGDLAKFKNWIGENRK
ncbi:SgcJ/EcaC family oxidoreductase [Maribacter sp. 2307UL18-2]|uniref:SgcJ/EcaC family oxidoreductase n=1 Tax=Maribacter sp. 2307UL18-2 TaxID=3386274 RepID=UPI0039BD60A2